MKINEPIKSFNNQFDQEFMRLQAPYVLNDATALLDYYVALDNIIATLVKGMWPTLTKLVDSLCRGSYSKHWLGKKKFRSTTFLGKGCSSHANSRAYPSFSTLDTSKEPSSTTSQCSSLRKTIEPGASHASLPTTTTAIGLSTTTSSVCIPTRAWILANKTKPTNDIASLPAEPSITIK